MRWGDNSGAVWSVAGESAEDKGLRRREAARRARDDAFGRLLGDDWVAVEPGIYRQVEPSAETNEDAPSPSGDSLDESLVDALPSAGDPDPDVEYRHEPAGRWDETQPRTPGRAWWRK